PVWRGRLPQPALGCLCRGGCPHSCWAHVRRGLVLSQNGEHAVLPLQFELLQTLALDFLGTGHEPQIIIGCKLCLILLMLLEQTTKLGMVPLDLLNKRRIKVV